MGGEEGAPGRPCPFGARLQSYWDRRLELFSRFDEGIRIDEEGLYSVKPEASARRIAERLNGAVVLDPFCGVGGSAIGLARTGKRVIASDIDRKRLDMARHNAAVYGVADHIDFSVEDALTAIAGARFDAIYLDPPWGGMDYYRKPRFLLRDFVPDGAGLLRVALECPAAVAITVPRNFAFTELAAFQRVFDVLPERAGERLVYSTVFFGM